jgi:hypothetical protein
LSNIAAPQFVGTSAPGAVGTTYGQASGDMISAAQQVNPALAQALTSGNAVVNYDADTGAYNLIDKTTGSPIAGNYQVQVGPNGTGINIPSGNGMIQVTAQTDQSGTIAPVTAANVQNVGLNRGAGGFAGGPDAVMATAGPAIAAVFPAAAPYILAYNSASAANKGKYGLALIDALSAAGVYAGQFPDSQIGQMVNGAIDAVKSSLPQSVQDALTSSTTPTTPTGSTDISAPASPTNPKFGNGLPSPDETLPPTGSTPGIPNTTPTGGTLLGDLTNAQKLPESVLNPNFINTPQPGDLTNLSQLGTGTASLPLTNTPIPFSNMVGVSPTSNSVTSTAPITPNATTPIVNNTGLPTGTTVNTTTGYTPTSNYTSQWQTLPDGTKIMVQDDGTAIANNPTTGKTYSLTAPQVTDLISKGNLNTPQSGYNAATGGTSTAPGGGTINPNGTTTLPNGQTITTPVNTPATPSLVGPVAATTGGLTAAQIAAAASAATALANSKTLTNANNSAAATQAAAGQNAQNLIQGLYTQQGQLQSPYQQTGVNALNTLGSLGSGTYNTMSPTGDVTGTGTGSGYLTNQFNNQDLNAQLAPNYAFQLQQGQGQARNAANVGGGLLSGNTLQGLNKYTQDYAQGAYQNAFTNYQTQRNNIYNTLAGQAGLGANANQQLSNLGGGLAQTYGNVTTGLAASAAGQQVANAQNQTNLLSNLTNAAVTAFAPTPATTTLKLTTA